MTAAETQMLLANTLSKIASKKEVKVKTAQVDKSHAEKVAESLDYLHANFELAFGSPIQRAMKTAGDLEVPNVVSHSQSSGPDGKRINETRDSMAVGEQPAEQPGGAKGKFEGVPNVVKNTAEHRPGGASVDPANTPLLNKTALSKVLAKLAKNKTAGDLDIPNQTRVMQDTDSGKGQSGYDGGDSHGNSNRHLIDTSNDEARKYDKGDAKKNYNKQQMSEVFDEVHPEKDKALDRAFEHGVEGAKLASGVTGNMGLGGLAAGGLREGASAVGNAARNAGASALSGISGVASKAHELGGRAIDAVGDAANYVKENPKKVLHAGAGLGALTGLSLGAGAAGNALGQSAMGEDPSLGRALGTGVGGGVLPLGLLASGHPGLAALSAVPGAYGGAALGEAIQNKLSPKQASVEDAEKLKAMATKEVAEEKKEEKAYPGIHKEIEKEACSCGKEGCKSCEKRVMKKAASILRSLFKGAEEVPTNAPAGVTPDATNQVAPPPEQAQGMGGQEDQIEKLKKLLLLMQMAKKQEEAQMMQGAPDASPGAGAASDAASAMAGPTQGAM